MRRQAIQFLSSKGDRLSWRPLEITERGDEVCIAMLIGRWRVDGAGSGLIRLGDCRLPPAENLRGDEVGLVLMCLIYFGLKELMAISIK